MNPAIDHRSLNAPSGLGILGGLGPLASADFLLSIYEHNMGEREQQTPTVFLHSLPSIPDRTECFLNGRDDELLALLERALDDLAGFGVARMVIACITFHHLLPRLPARFAGKIISLVDLTLEHVARSRRPHMLLCTNGTRQMRIFERHEKWSRVESHIIRPDGEDQQRIHETIYSVIKSNRELTPVIELLQSLAQKYAVRSFIAGCTEFHRVSRLIARDERLAERIDFTDSLLIIAKNYEELINEKCTRLVEPELRKIPGETRHHLAGYEHHL